MPQESLVWNVWLGGKALEFVAVGAENLCVSCRNLGENYSVSVASKLFVLLTRVQGGLQQPLGAVIPHM